MKVQTLMMRPVENAYGDLEFGGRDRLILPRLVWAKKELLTYFSNIKGTIFSFKNQSLHERIYIF